MNKKKLVMTAFSLIFVGLNFVLFLYLFFINPPSHYFGPFIYMIPTYYIIYFSGLYGIFVLTIVFLSGLALTLIKLYRFAAPLCLLGGVFTIPLGFLGIIGSTLIWSLSNILDCPFCGSSLVKDRRSPGYSFCTVCGKRFILRR